MSENDLRLNAKAMLLVRGFMRTIEAILSKENPNVDPWQALDELSIVLNKFNDYLKKKVPK